METNKYTEYSQEISTGSVVVQVPEKEELSVQIILNLGRQLILSADEYVEITQAVAEALTLAGRAIKEKGTD